MDKRVQKVISHMQGHPPVQQLTVPILSRSVNLSPGRLRQLFKKETGRSPKQYLKEIRMQTAERLLRSTFLSIKEIAFQSGANDVSHFVRDFKGKYGKTPSTFRAD